MRRSFPTRIIFLTYDGCKTLGRQGGGLQQLYNGLRTCCLGSLPSHGKLQWRQRLPAHTHLWADAIFCAARRWALATAFEKSGESSATAAVPNGPPPMRPCCSRGSRLAVLAVPDPRFLFLASRWVIAFAYVPIQTLIRAMTATTRWLWSSMRAACCNGFGIVAGFT